MNTVAPPYGAVAIANTILRAHIPVCGHMFPHCDLLAQMKLKRSPRFVKVIYWEASSFLRAPFTEGCAGANEKALPPGRQQRCTFSPTI